MSDLFHADVPREFIGQVLSTMVWAPQHEFQVLTKRAERMERVMTNYHEGLGSLSADALSNLWLGVSVETPAYYSRVRHLARTPSATRFLSCEPLLAELPRLPLGDVDWVIIGGESGPGARPLDLAWVRGIVLQCRMAGVAVFVKQLGSAFGAHKGRDMGEWPEDLKVREYPRQERRP